MKGDLNIKMFNLIGLGLNLNNLSKEAVSIVKKADKIYLESYTIDFPYTFEELEKSLGKKIIKLAREPVEEEKFVEEAKNKNIVLLVYGSPLMATTHISLLLKCKKEKINYQILNNASVFDAVAETGLQFYKFGKTASLPSWKDKGKSLSFTEIILNNISIHAHTLILVDMNLHLKEALEELEEAFKEKKIKYDKIVVCSRLGTEKSKIIYGKIEELKKQKLELPICFILPSKLHFLEEEALMSEE